MTPKNPFADPEHPIDYNIRGKDVKEPQKSEPKKVPVSPAPNQIRTDFSLEELADSYRITGVRYRNGIYAVDFSKSVLPEKTQDEHAEHAKQAKPDEFVAASAPLVYAICRSLYKNEERQYKKFVENARQTLEEVIGEEIFICTLSRAIYNPNGVNDVIHEYKQKTQYTKKATLIGDENFIVLAGATEYSQALLDTTDEVVQINEVFKWVTKENSYARRFKSQPTKKAEQVVALGVYDGDGISKFEICADDLTDEKLSAFGVRV